jgi:hypothetical protein
MCNAHNHPPGCTCGWGGEGHAGRSYGGWAESPAISYRPSRPPVVREWRERDFTRPAKCPKCGAGVFFIRHNGGSVWVDPPLGWPWPKHPCFDEPHEPTRRFASWSPKSSGLTDPELAIIKRIQTVESTNESVVEVEFTDTTRASLILRWTPNDESLAGSLVFISEPDSMLLHPRYAEIPFHSFTRMPPVGHNGWYTCARCKASVKHGTGHEDYCRLHYKRPPASPSQPKSLPLWRQRLRPGGKTRSFRPSNPQPVKKLETERSVPPSAPAPLSLEARIKQAMDKVAREAWLAAKSELPSNERFTIAKREAIRLIKMLSPHVRRQVEHRFSSQKWSPLLAARPK